MKQNKYSNSGPPEKNLNFSQMPKQTPKQQKEQELKKQLDEYYKKKFQQGRQDWQEANDVNTLDQRNILQGMWNIAQFVDPGISTNTMNIGINKLRGTPQEPGDYAGILGSLIPYGKNITQTTKPFIKKILGNIDKGEDAYNLVTQQYGGEANWLDQYDEGGPTDPIKLPGKPDSMGVSESTGVRINIPDLSKVSKMNRNITLPKRVEEQKNIATKKGEKKNFAVVDKGRDSIYVFNPKGNLITAEPVITGASRNDTDKGLSMKDWMKQTGNTNHDDYFKYLKSIKAQTTPAGAFRIGSMRTNTSENPDMLGNMFNQFFRPDRAEQIRQSRLRDYGHQEKLFTLINDKGVPSSKAMHGTGNEKRIEAFNTPGADRAMSNGCINLYGKTVCFDLLGVGSHLFTLPEENENLITDYNFKKMKGGQTNWLDQYELGGYTEDPIKKLAQSNNAVKVNQVPKGYKQLGVSGNKTYYDKEAREAVPGTIGGGPDGDWEKSIIKMLQEGVSPEELVKKGHISRSSVPKFQQYYKPVYTETIQPQSTNTTGSNTNVTKVQDKKQLDFEFGVPWAGERKDVTHLVGSGIYSYKDESGKEYGVRAYDLPGQYDSKAQKWNTNEGYGNATRIYAYEKDNKLIPFDPNFSTTFSDDKAKKVYYTKTGLDPKYISQKEQSKALEKGPQTQMASGSDFLLNQGAKYNPNLDTTSNLNQGNLSTGTFTNINKTVGEENLPSFREKEFKHGGMKKLPGAKRFTSKNIQSSINTLFSRNYDLFGPSGKKYYSPLSKYAPGGEPDVPVIPDPEMVGYVLPEFTVTADAPDYAPAVKKFMETQGTEQGYVDALKRDYINRQAGLNQLAGLNMKQFPQDVEENFRRNYQYDKNTAIMDELARQRGFDITDRASYIDKLSPEEKAILANSRYGEYLQPSYNARSLAGLKELGKYMGLGNIADAISIPGLTRKEQEDIRNEKMLGIPTGGLQAFQVFDIPGQALANLVRTSGNLSTGSDFRTMPGNMPGDETSPWPAGRSASDVSDLDAAMMNPLNWTMATDIPELISKIPQGARALRKFFTKDPGDLEAAQYFNDYERARTALDDADFAEWKNRKAEEAAQREDDLYRQYLNSQQNPFPSERELDNMYRAYNESEPNIDTRDIRSQYANDIARWAREYEQDNFINPFEPDPLDVEDYTMQDYIDDLDDTDDPFGGLPSSGQSNQLSSEAQDINSFTDEDMVDPTSSYPSSITDLVRNNSNIQSFADIQNYYNNNPAAFIRLMGMYANPELIANGSVNFNLASQLFDLQRTNPNRYRNMLYDINRDLSGTGFSNQLPPPPSEINIPSEVTNLRRIEQPYASSRQANREIRDFLNAQDIDTVFLQKELESADQFPSILREAGLPENVTVDDLGNLTDSQRAEFVRAIRNRVVDMINSNDPIIQRARQHRENQRNIENFNNLGRTDKAKVLDKEIDKISKKIPIKNKDKIIEKFGKDKTASGYVEYMTHSVMNPEIHKLNDTSVITKTEDLDPLIESLQNLHDNLPDGAAKDAVLMELEDARSTKWLRTEYVDELRDYYGLDPDGDFSIITNEYNPSGDVAKSIVDGKGNILGTMRYDWKTGKVISSGVNFKFHNYKFGRPGDISGVSGIKEAQALLEKNLFDKFQKFRENPPELYALNRMDTKIYKKTKNMSDSEFDNYIKNMAEKRIKQIEWNNNNKVGEGLYRALYHGNKEKGFYSTQGFVDTQVPHAIQQIVEQRPRAGGMWEAGTKRKNPKTNEPWPIYQYFQDPRYNKELVRVIREFGGQRNWLDNY